MSAFDDLLKAGFREQRQQTGCTVTVGAVTVTGIRSSFEFDEQVKLSGKRLNIDLSFELEDADFAALGIREGDELTIDGQTVRLLRLGKDSGFTRLDVAAPR